ncbi:MAG: NTPase [Candidatus Zixiibacteriota bacterium]
MAATNILITGAPGVGKTTLIRRLHDRLSGLKPVGFFTHEIRRGGGRQGFEIAAFDGRKGILSHVDIKSRHRVGKYGVDVDGFNRFLDEIDLDAPHCELIIIDEIGKMECLSSRFQNLIGKLLDSPRLLIATIARHGGGVIAETKRRSDVMTYEVTRSNRNTLAETIVKYVQNQLIR